jgi:hypothetical protein
MRAVIVRPKVALCVSTPITPRLALARISSNASSVNWAAQLPIQRLALRMLCGVYVRDREQASDVAPSLTPSR